MSQINKEKGVMKIGKRGTMISSKHKYCKNRTKTKSESMIKLDRLNKTRLKSRLKKPKTNEEKAY